MAVTRYVQRVTQDAGGQQRSVAWYRKKIAELGKPRRADLLKEGKLSPNAQFGYMNLFIYDPKLKRQLPYYDTFPLVVPLESYRDGFLGLNFHYLPRPLRLTLVDQVTKFQKGEKVAVDYSKLKRINLIRPCLKRYLYSHVESDFRRIEIEEFAAATMLPIAQFQKASTGKVYSDSRRLI